MSIIRETIESGNGHALLEYHDATDFSGLPYGLCRQVYGVCFFNGKLILGFDGGGRKVWTLVGGTIEPGESFLETLTREVREESNMEVISSQPIGYQKVTLPSNENFYQLRYACLVRPHAEFVADPAGSITKIAIIDPTDYLNYFDWGQIGERLVTRGLQISLELDQN